MHPILRSLMDTLRTLLEKLNSPPNLTEIALLATAGERLRRVLSDFEVKSNSKEAVELLGRYDAALRAAPIEGTAIWHAVMAALEELEKSAALERAERDPDDIQFMASGLGEALWVATAAHRAGKLPEVDLEFFAEEVRTCVARIAGQLPELWEYAVLLQATYGIDEDYPFVDAWLEELACLAPSRRAFLQALRRPTAERTREAVERAAARLEQT